MDDSTFTEFMLKHSKDVPQLQQHLLDSYTKNNRKLSNRFGGFPVKRQEPNRTGGFP